jgi:hypothetical protein
MLQSHGLQHSVKWRVACNSAQCTESELRDLVAAMEVRGVDICVHVSSSRKDSADVMLDTWIWQDYMSSLMGSASAACVLITKDNVAHLAMPCKVDHARVDPFGSLGIAATTDVMLHRSSHTPRVTERPAAVKHQVMWAANACRLCSAPASAVPRRSFHRQCGKLPSHPKQGHGPAQRPVQVRGTPLAACCVLDNCRCGRRRWMVASSYSAELAWKAAALATHRIGF